MKPTENGTDESANTEIPRSFDAALIFSSLILAIVLATSVYLFIENRSLTSEIDKVKTESASYDQSIALGKADHAVMAAEIIQNAKTALDQTIRATEAQRYISELLNISRKYRIDFSGFSFANGKISSAATSSLDTLSGTGDSVTKISALIRDYRTATGATIFHLDPVTGVAGIEQRRSFQTDFIVDGTNVK